MVDTVDYGPMDELGVTGLSKSGGSVMDERLPELRGKLGRLAFREMADNDPVAGAMLFGIERLIAGLDWHMQPGADDPQALERADFVWGALHDMSQSFDATLGEVLSMLPQGFAPLEIVYKRRLGPEQDDSAMRSAYSDGRIGWRKWALRAQETVSEWVWDDTGGLAGFIQMDGSSGSRAAIPMEKALLFRTTTARSNPEGRSVLRNAYRPYWFKKLVEEIEAIGIERDLAGLPVAHMPPEYLVANADATKKQVLRAVQDIVTGIKRNETEGVVFPRVYDEHGNKAMELELLSTGGTRQFDTDKTIGRYDQRIAMTLLADFILLGHEAVGTYALGASKVDLFTQAIASWAKGICEVVNQHAIPRLLRLNGMPTTDAPTLQFGDLKHVDLKALAEFIARVAPFGLEIDERTEAYLRQVSGLPQLEGGLAE